MASDTVSLRKELDALQSMRNDEVITDEEYGYLRKAVLACYSSGGMAAPLDAPAAESTTGTDAHQYWETAIRLNPWKRSMFRYQGQWETMTTAWKEDKLRAVEALQTTYADRAKDGQLTPIQALVGCHLLFSSEFPDGYGWEAAELSFEERAYRLPYTLLHPSDTQELCRFHNWNAVRCFHEGYFDVKGKLVGGLQYPRYHHSQFASCNAKLPDAAQSDLSLISGSPNANDASTALFCKELCSDEHPHYVVGNEAQHSALPVVDEQGQYTGLRVDATFLEQFTSQVQGTLGQHTAQPDYIANGYAVVQPVIEQRRARLRELAGQVATVARDGGADSGYITMFQLRQIIHFLDAATARLQGPGRSPLQSGVPGLPDATKRATKPLTPTPRHSDRVGRETGAARTELKKCRPLDGIKPMPSHLVQPKLHKEALEVPPNRTASPRDAVIPQANVRAAAGATPQCLPLYTNIRDPDDSTSHPDRKATLARCQRNDRTYPLIKAEPATVEDVEKTSKLLHNDPQARLLLWLMWTFAARPSDILSLLVLDVTLDADTGKASLTERPGKPARFSHKRVQML